VQTLCPFRTSRTFYARGTMHSFHHAINRILTTILVLPSQTKPGDYQAAVNHQNQTVLAPNQTLFDTLTKTMLISPTPKMAPLTLALALSLAFKASAQSAITPHYEVDIIFPRNETYLPSSTFPIAIAVQNLSVAAAIGNLTIEWGIEPWDGGNIPGMINYGAGDFGIPPDAASKPAPYTILVDHDNVTEWVQKKSRGERYLFYWALTSYEFQRKCNGSDTLYRTTGSVMFSVEGDWEAGAKPNSGWVDGGKGKPADIMQVPECPDFSRSVEIRPNGTVSACPRMVDLGTKNPCAVKVDKAAASSIVSRVSVLAAPTPTSTRVTSTPNAAATRYPLQTALAAACLLCGLVL